MKEMLSSTSGNLLIEIAVMQNRRAGLSGKAQKAAVQDYFTLGGFLRLSGLQRGEISGPHSGLGRLVFYRRVGEPSGLLDTPLYLGVSAEAGNVWQNRSDMGIDSLQFNGSAFAGFDTFIGPVYIAAGFAEGGQSNFYLFVGGPPR